MVTVSVVPCYTPKSLPPKKTYFGFVVKFNESGDVLWNKTFDYEGYDRITDILPLEEGGVIVTGHYGDPDMKFIWFGGEMTYVRHYDSNGKLLQEREFSGRFGSIKYFKKDDSLLSSLTRFLKGYGSIKYVFLYDSGNYREMFDKLDKLDKSAAWWIFHPPINSKDKLDKLDKSVARRVIDQDLKLVFLDSELKEIKTAEIYNLVNHIVVEKTKIPILPSLFEIISADKGVLIAGNKHSNPLFIKFDNKGNKEWTYHGDNFKRSFEWDISYIVVGKKIYFISETLEDSKSFRIIQFGLRK